MEKTFSGISSAFNVLERQLAENHRHVSLRRPTRRLSRGSHRLTVFNLAQWLVEFFFCSCKLIRGAFLDLFCFQYPDTIRWERLCTSSVARWFKWHKIWAQFIVPANALQNYFCSEILTKLNSCSRINCKHISHEILLVLSQLEPCKYSAKIVMFYTQLYRALTEPNWSTVGYLYQIIVFYLDLHENSLYFIIRLLKKPLHRES